MMYKKRRCKMTKTSFDKKIEIVPYLSCSNIHDEVPLFDLLIGGRSTSFQIIDLTENEVRAFIKEIEDCLETWLMAKTPE